jgi:hypothetical protein
MGTCAQNLYIFNQIRVPRTCMYSIRHMCPQLVCIQSGACVQNLYSVYSVKYVCPGQVHTRLGISDLHLYVFDWAHLLITCTCSSSYVCPDIVCIQLRTPARTCRYSSIYFCKFTFLCNFTKWHCNRIYLSLVSVRDKPSIRLQAGQVGSRGSFPGKSKKYFSSSDRPWGPPSLLFSG